MVSDERSAAPNEGATPYLQASALAVRYGDFLAVQDATLSAQLGQITALIGPNGAGKSTVFNAVSGFQRLAAGEVLVDGRDRTGVAPYRLSKDGLVRTFQLTKTLKDMTVLDNMRVGARHHLGESLLACIVLRPRVKRVDAEINDEAEGLLERFKLTHVKDELAGNLSGGQAKLLEMARALMMRPKMLLLDEPLAGVNPRLRDDILDHMVEVKESGVGLLFVEHDMGAVMDVSDKVIVMAEGKDIAAGTPREVQGDSRVINAYLGVS